jgi:hypothetical protein
MKTRDKVPVFVCLSPYLFWRSYLREYVVDIPSTSTEHNSDVCPELLPRDYVDVLKMVFTAGLNFILESNILPYKNNKM